MPPLVHDVERLYANAAFVNRLKVLIGNIDQTNYARLLEEREYFLTLLERFLDPDECEYGNGACQMHNCPRLSPGEVCPQEELRAVLMFNGRTQ